MEWNELFARISQSRERAAQWVYEIGTETPLQKQRLNGASVWLKREDQSMVNSYKWRGAYTKIRDCVESGQAGPFVATSAGNHAQGVALAAATLGVRATIFMPRSTPKLKRSSVARLGKSNVEIRLVGDNFEQASAAAVEYATTHNLTTVKPFDDVNIIAGQSTVGDELFRQAPELDCIYVPIGGGGLASGVSFALQALSSRARVVGVEVRGQESMYQSISQGKVSRLETVDTFCDGTAVMQPGDLTFAVCHRLLERVELVTNEQVCAAIQRLWEECRVITEPSGAIAFAGLLQDVEEGKVDLAKTNCCAVLSGANTDFLTLPLIVNRSQLAQPSRCYYRFEIEERGGSLIELLDLLFEDVNIVDFQYGKIGHQRAFPVLGLYASEEQQNEMRERILRHGIPAVDVTRHQSSQFRVIPFRPDLTRNAVFLHVDFPDRPGALRELMREISPFTNICYFNFNDTGQIEGHALIGFEFAEGGHRAIFEQKMAELHFQYRLADMEGVFGE